MGRIMAFDFGTKRVGIAVTDQLKMIANSLATIDTKNIFSFIKNYCAKEDVEAFVVGYPYNFGYSENDNAKNVEVFITELKKHFPSKEIHKVDERFTSSIAKQTLLQSGVSKKERRKKGNVDTIAANLILQSFLETLNR